MFLCNQIILIWFCHLLLFLSFKYVNMGCSAPSSRPILCTNYKIPFLLFLAVLSNSQELQCPRTPPWHYSYRALLVLVHSVLTLCSSVSPLVHALWKSELISTLSTQSHVPHHCSLDLLKEETANKASGRFIKCFAFCRLRVPSDLKNSWTRKNQVWEIKPCFEISCVTREIQLHWIPEFNCSLSNSLSFWLFRGLYFTLFYFFKFYLLLSQLQAGSSPSPNSFKSIPALTLNSFDPAYLRSNFLLGLTEIHSSLSFSSFFCFVLFSLQRISVE